MVAADDDLAGLGQARNVGVAARLGGVLAVAHVIRANVIVVAKGVEGVVANVTSAIATANVVGTRVAIVAEGGEQGLVRSAISVGGVAELGTTCVNATIVGNVKACRFASAGHARVVSARVVVIARNRIHMAKSIRLAARLRIARVVVVALDFGEQASGLAADVGARVVGALVGVLAHHGYNLAALLRIAHVWVANITGILARDGGVSADSLGESARGVDGAGVVGARVVVVATVGRNCALFVSIAGLGVARVAVGTRAASAHNTELIHEGMSAVAINGASVHSARVAIVASPVLVDTSKGNIALGSLASVVGRAGNWLIRTHSIRANIVRASIIIRAIHSSAVLASKVSIANLREALVRSITLDHSTV